MSGEDLRARWFDGELLSPAGELRLKNRVRGGAAQQRAAAEMSLMVSSEVPEKPLVGENLGKGRVPEGLVVRGAKFDLTADASPSGGSNLEWVTDPLDTVAEVGSVLDSVTSMARYLNGRQRRRLHPCRGHHRRAGACPCRACAIYPFEGRSTSPRRPPRGCVSTGCRT